MTVFGILELMMMFWMARPLSQFFVAPDNTQEFD